MARMLIDCDGVLCDMLTPLSKASGIPVSDVTEWDLPFPDMFLQTLDVRRLPTYPGAKQFVKTLRELGHEVICVTAPPVPLWSWGQDRWATDRDQWLINFGFAPNEIVQARDKSLIKGDYLLDDNPHHVEGRPGGVLLDRPYNRECNWPRVKSLGEFVRRYA